MGQYYLTCNLDKKEYLDPHAFDDGLKLMEFGCSRNGTMLALAVLLADGNGKGGGDLHSDHKIIGSWAGDRIVVAGDYADEDHWPEDVKGMNTYSTIRESGEDAGWRDVSLDVLKALMDDDYVRKDTMKQGAYWYVHYGEDNSFLRTLKQVRKGHKQASSTWRKVLKETKQAKENNERLGALLPEELSAEHHDPGWLVQRLGKQLSKIVDKLNSIVPEKQVSVEMVEKVLVVVGQEYLKGHKIAPKPRIKLQRRIMEVR